MKFASNINNITLLIIFNLSLYPCYSANYDSINNHKPWLYWYIQKGNLTNEYINDYLNRADSLKFGGLHVIPIENYNTQPENIEKLIIDTPTQIINSITHIAKNKNMGIAIELPNKWPNRLDTTNYMYAANKLNYIKIDSLRPDTTIRLTIDSLLEDNTYLVSVFAFSKDMTEKIDITWLINKINYTEYFMPNTGWEIYLFYLEPSDYQNNTYGFYYDHFCDTIVSGFSNKYYTNIADHNIKSVSNTNYDMSNASWSNYFFDEFNKRKNYDLKQHVYCFIDEVKVDYKSRILCDYFETLSELAEYSYYGNLTKFFNQSNITYKTAINTSNLNIIDIISSSDIAEIDHTEISHTSSNYDKLSGNTDNDNMYYYRKLLSSTNNILNSCKIDITDLGYVNSTIALLKPEIDLLFTSGINHIFSNSIDWSPFNKLWEEPHALSPIWEDIKNINEYITNCQQIFQQSQPDNDILIYLPIYDYWSNFDNANEIFEKNKFISWFNKSTITELSKELVSEGLSFDYVSDNQINNLIIKNNKYHLGDAEYKVLIFPKCTFVPLKTLQNVIKLAEDGGKVIFSSGLPKDVPGYYKFETNRLHLLEIKYSLFVNQNITVVHDLYEAYILNRISNEELVNHKLRYIRKKYNNETIYFITNNNNKEFNEWIRLSTITNNYKAYNPVNNQLGYLDVNNKSEIHLQIKPGESIFIFCKDKVKEEKKWVYSKLEAQSVILNENWKVSFSDKSKIHTDTVKLPYIYQSEKIVIPRIVNLSGKVKYERKFDLPVIIKPSQYYMLNIGELSESATIKINGYYIGKIWCDPYELIIDPKFLKRKNNHIEIEMNVFLNNRFIEAEKLKESITQAEMEHYKDFYKNYWQSYKPGIIYSVILTPIIP